MCRELQPIKGKIVEMAKDQSQCFHLQHILEQLSPSAITEFYHEVQPALHELVVDPVGSFLFQKLVPFLSEEMKLDLVCLM